MAFAIRLDMGDQNERNDFFVLLLNLACDYGDS